LKKAAAGRKPASERKRPADEAVAYAVGNGTRIEALAILAEGEHSPSQIAEMLGVEIQLVNNHIRELYACGCIELERTTTVRNATQSFYRALATPHVSDEAYRAMPVEARREVVSVLIQAIVAETMASFRAGKIEADDDVALMWDCLTLDKQGRGELLAETQAHFERILEIQLESAGRLTDSNEEGITTFVSLTAFERSRSGRPEKRFVYPPEKS
jgi:DNA-binding transcriptional ArsR family regulator